MGTSKHSRKGKKAWRKNIDTGEVQEFIADATHKQRRGPELQSLKDTDLFFVDTEAVDGGAATTTQPQRAAGKKLLRSQAILQAPQAVQAVVRPRGGKAPLAAAAPAPAKRAKRRRPGNAPLTDVWAAEEDMRGADAAVPTAAPPAAAAAAAAAWAVAPPRPSGRKRQRLQRAHVPSGAPVMRAVEVDAGGCSFNPEPEQHQDALADVVAVEMRRALKAELAPTAPPRTVPGAAPLEGLDALQVDAELDEGEEAGEQAPSVAAPYDANAIALDDDDADADAAPLTPAPAPNGAVAAASQRAASDRKTRKDRNREARRRAAEAEAAARQALKAQRRQLDALGELQEEVAVEETRRAAKRLRREVVKAEKATQQPPRLGKERFEPDAAPVLTSDELTGSLRQLAPCFLVAKERFKSLQKRGLIEPRRPAPQRKARRVAYVGGERTEKAVAAQEEVTELRKARMALHRQAKKAAASAKKGAGDASGAAGAFGGTDLWG